MFDPNQRLMAGNLLANLPPKSADESLEVLAESHGLRIERIVSHGHAAPDDQWLAQPQAEFVVLVSGQAHVQFEGEAAPRALGPGDYLMIPAHCRHRVAWTALDEPSVWLALHYDK